MKVVNSLIVFVLLVVFGSLNTTLAQNLWEPAGVSGGGVSTFLKITDDIFLAGYVGGGLFRSTDGGENWLQRDTTGLKAWRTIALSSDGTI